MDATHRTEFRDLFEVHLARFEARLVRWMFFFWIATLGTIALLKL